jgi:hypothetical protein
MMREKYEISIRITNTDKGFVVVVTVENKETRTRHEKKEIFTEIPIDFESLIWSAIMECEK